jgi:hypothetical protein
LKSRTGGGAINRTSDFILRLDSLGSRLVKTKNVKQHILKVVPAYASYAVGGIIIHLV